MRSVRHLILGALLVSAFTLPASAQLNRAYVSVARGADANACSYGAPCRTIGKAVSVLNSGGEVILIDGGGFGPFTIDRSVSIQAPQSVFAGVIAGSGNAITVNAVDGVVILRGLTLTGVGADVGVLVENAAALHLEDVIVNGFAGFGVFPGTADQVYLRRTAIRNNHYGMYSESDLEQIDISITDSYFDNNISGIYLQPGARLAAADTSISGSSQFGLVAGNAVAFLDRCSVSHNLYGIFSSGASGRIYASGSDITFNTAGIAVSSSGSTLTNGTNTVAQNTGGSTFTGTFTNQ